MESRDIQFMESVAIRGEVQRWRRDTRLDAILVLRPGALGDVLVCRHALAWLRLVFPDAAMTVAAPGGKGRLLAGKGFADVGVDWDGAAFSWLFADAAGEAPQALSQLFGDETLVLAYVADTGAAGNKIVSRLRRLAGTRTVHVHLSPSRPPDGYDRYIGEWLVEGVASFCRTRGLLSEPDTALRAAKAGKCPAGRLLFSDVCGNPERLVIHPGSGSARKNWPLERYAGLARKLMQGDCGFGRVFITSGEADGDLGERLAGMLPEAEHVFSPGLDELARLLASARLFVGNDSGVSHLASSVCGPDDWVPRVAAFFGPSSPAVWAPPSARIISAGADMRGIDASGACDIIGRWLKADLRP